jgi:hypothetical protein
VTQNGTLEELKQFDVGSDLVSGRKLKEDLDPITFLLMVAIARKDQAQAPLF